MKNLTATYLDGMKGLVEVDVTGYRAWVKNRLKTGSSDDIWDEFVGDVRSSKKITINDLGIIDGFSDTPNYINGEQSVYQLLYDGKVVFNNGILLEY
jgi:hypothetical protein